ncbi:Jag N-terminal domain-containing protein [Campylobacter corcagiensis]|uniref:Jag N-terminal domain-containing protein n=1 Tax=Campylobacter corcagiensis TaxID=1448857 RepID=A0A7M1LEK5_9BACT|nr:Jag N-terminal domain-containing protein [Campylobacter corcagiensis]QKF65091.1 Jag domain-containing protein [Campylobacter corcagiensis]QOQ86763.1 Jag N-terminal domain-containing protein [Campylobacter corcagiensis]
MRVEAQTLEEAIIKAAKELNCSTLDLDMKVLQHPSKGILGFFKKNAIIEASNLKVSTENIKAEPRVEKKPQNKSEKRFDSKNKKSIHKVINEIKSGLDTLFGTGCFDISVVDVSSFDNTTIDIKLDGKDAALLIGREGHRYKALSYLLYNWINFKYGYHIRLEISEFLKNQEEMIDAYLVDIIEKVESGGKAQTKPLDGVLVKIALSKLRERFPDKYVGARNSKNGRFIVINERRDAKK